jgi:DNA modification methylase
MSDESPNGETPRQRSQRSSTATSDFGVGRRESHDASAFYSRFSPPELSTDATVHPHKAIDEIICGDSRDMSRVPSNSVALVVTSPPYFAGKAYELELGERGIPATYVEYLQMLRDVFAECVRTLEPGGRMAINVANLGRKPFRNLAADVTTILQDDLRLLLRGEVIWLKQRGASGNCAWGSFRKPGNPTLRDLTERVIIAGKGRFDRAVSQKDRVAQGLPHVATINADEFMEGTLDVWEIPPERATVVGHPAPFPVALPERLIQLHTYAGDLVLDPFMGSGSTAIAAVRTGRHYVGYDTDQSYVDLATRRAGEAFPSPPAVDSAKTAAKSWLAVNGWTVIGENVKVAAGVVVDFSARRPDGIEALIDVAGVVTAARPGLQRSEVAWKTAGTAAVIAAKRPGTPYVVMTPSRGADPVLKAITGSGQAIDEIIEFGS